MPVGRPDVLQLLFQLRLQNGAISYIANDSRTTFVITNSAFLTIDLPRRAHAITPLAWRRHNRDLRNTLETLDAVKTITNYLSLGCELSFVCELLKVTATAKAKVRTRWLNPNRRWRDDLFNRRKQQLTLRAIDLHPHAISGCRE